MTKLTAIVLTYNEEQHIADCLASLAFADERLVFDSFSTDNTVQLARDAGAEVVRHEFVDYAQQRNAALDHVHHTTDWVLFVDADERVPPDLAEEVRGAIMARDIAGYRIPRFNYLFGKLTKGAGWYPDYQTRLLKVGSSHYDTQYAVHERVLLNGAEGTLQNHFIHYNYEHIQQFIAKQRRYVRYDAQILHEQGICPKPQNYILQPLRHFKWRYLEMAGWRDGWHGLQLSAIMSWYEFRKYWILRELCAD